jgi:ABC-type sugar transport system substrate-binding protein
MEILTKAGITELEREIKADALTAPQNLKDIFCKGWPGAKAVIEALMKIIKNPIVVLILQGVEAVGDAAQKAICP